MNLDSILEAIKKHGMSAVFFVILWFKNERLEKVEDKLYNCYTTMQVLSAKKQLISHTEFIAIIPHDIYTKRHIQRYVKA